MRAMKAMIETPNGTILEKMGHRRLLTFSSEHAVDYVLYIKRIFYGKEEWVKYHNYSTTPKNWEKWAKNATVVTIDQNGIKEE